MRRKRSGVRSRGLTATTEPKSDETGARVKVSATEKTSAAKLIASGQSVWPGKAPETFQALWLNVKERCLYLSALMAGAMSLLIKTAPLRAAIGLDMNAARQLDVAA